MRSIRTVLPLIAALALPSAAAAQRPFEGAVTYAMRSGAGETMTMVHFVKGDDIRVDMNAGGMAMSMLTNMSGSRQIMVMHPQRQWMDAAAMQARMGGGQAAAAAARPADLRIRATGRKSTVAGHECEHFIFTSSGSEVDVCAARGLGWYFGLPAGGPQGNRRGGNAPAVPGLSNAQLAEWRRLHAQGFFPLKMTVSGAQPVTITVTKIERKTLDPAVFRTPAGYTEMRMGGR